eukprot:350494-Chlamydomonas_euryale.AAC.13
MQQYRTELQQQRLAENVEPSCKSHLPRLPVCCWIASPSTTSSTAIIRRCLPGERYLLGGHAPPAAGACSTKSDNKVA